MQRFDNGRTAMLRQRTDFATHAQRDLAVSVCQEDIGEVIVLVQRREFGQDLGTTGCIRGQRKLRRRSEGSAGR